MRGGPQFDETPLHALRLMGLPEPEIANVRAVLLARHRRELIEVWPEHWHAIALFMAMDTQWRSHGGLDYSVLPIVERRLARLPRALRQPREVLFAQLGIIEREVLRLWAEQAAPGS